MKKKAKRRTAAARFKPPATGRWRPIRSAPKDRQIILACLENGEDFYVCQGRWVDVPHTNVWVDLWKKNQHLSLKEIDQMASEQVEGHWMEAHVGYMQHGTETFTHEDRGGILFHPTHWMPLPDGPRSRGAWKRARKLAGQQA